MTIKKVSRGAADNGFMRAPENLRIADRLREAAQLLANQGASSYRVHAYRHAADAIERLPWSVRGVYEREGVKGLDAIPRVGLGIAADVAEMLATHRWGLLEALRAKAPPELLLRSVDGVGPGLAARLHDTLHIESLEQLEIAAWDGRLGKLSGVGERRAAGIRACVAGMLGHDLPRITRSRKP